MNTLAPQPVAPGPSDVLEEAAHTRRPEALLAPEDWWRETLLRLALLVLLALTCEWVLYGAPFGALGQHPHPYWLVVLPLAAARGLVAGLLGAATCGALVLAAALLASPTDASPLLPLGAAALEPLLFALVAVLVGELCDVARTALRESDAARAELTARLATLQHERDVLEASARELERRLAYGPADVGSLIGAARRMERADLHGLYDVTLELVLEHVADAASIVEVEPDGRLVLVAARGAPTLATTIAAGLAPGEPGADRDCASLGLSPLVRAALLRGEPGNVFDLGEDEAPPGPCMVAPLFDHARAVKALLLVDGLAPTRLGPSSFRTFVGLADWASSGLARLAIGAAPLGAPRSGAAGERGVVVPRRLGTPEALERRVVREFARCDRHALNVSVLGVQFALDGERADSVLERLDGAVVELLGRGLRASDGLYAFGFPGCYAVVLAGTDLGGAGVVRARTEANALAVERRLGVAATTHVVGPEQGAVTPRLALAELAERFRADAHRPLGIVERAPVDAGSVGPLDELVERIACEAELGRRFGLPFQLLEVVLPAERAAGRRVSPRRLPEAVTAAAASALRGGAEAFDFGDDRFIFLLAGLPTVAGASVVLRFSTLLESQGSDARVRHVFDSEGDVDVGVLVQTLRGGRAA